MHEFGSGVNMPLVQNGRSACLLEKDLTINVDHNVWQSL